MSGVALLLVPALPLAAFALLALGLSRFCRLAAGLAIAALGGSTVLALGLLLAGAATRVTWTWLRVGGRELQLALWSDPLAVIVASLVTVVALLVFVYAAGYMADDPRRGRFFAELSLFAGSMLTLVLAADLLTLFIAWELVGLCSYLLIGFWFERPGVPAAATKAFLVTRLADLMLLLGILFLLGALGTSRLDVALAAARDGHLAQPLLVTAALLLFAGAAGKSAQVPFQGWLPDAMLGPTPISALLHSATMVAAGVFLVARAYPLFQAAGPVLGVVAWVGALTALLGGATALVERDLKRTLAYSTMSQIGLMFVGLGAGSLLAGVILLVGHALFKALLFLCAGVVDRAVDGTDFARMGGLRARLPAVFAAFVIGALPLAGLPVTLALPPKDPVLSATWLAGGLLFLATLVASALSALYAARMVGLVFLGQPSAAAREAGAPPPGLLLPTLTLAALVPIGLVADAAVLNRPLARLLGVESPEALPATVVGLLVAAAGSALGLGLRARWPVAVVWPPLIPAEPLLAGELGFRPLYRALGRAGVSSAQASGWLDRRTFEPAGAWLAARVLSMVRAAGGLDRALFDRVGEAAADFTLGVVRATFRFDLGRLDAAVSAGARGLLAAGERLRALQTGQIDNYLLPIFGWGLGAALVALLALLTR